MLPLPKTLLPLELLAVSALPPETLDVTVCGLVNVFARPRRGTSPGRLPSEIVPVRFVVGRLVSPAPLPVNDVAVIVPFTIWAAPNILEALVRATVGSTASWMFPLIPPPTRPDPAVTPVIVPLPVPGKVCPEAKATIPLGATDNPVGAGALLPAPNSRLRLAEGLAPWAFTAYQRNVWLLAVLPLEAEAIKSSGLKGDPEVGELPVAGRAAPPLAVNNPAADKLLLNVPVAPQNRAKEVSLVQVFHEHHFISLFIIE